MTKSWRCCHRLVASASFCVKTHYALACALPRAPSDLLAANPSVYQRWSHTRCPGENLSLLSSPQRTCPRRRGQFPATKSHPHHHYVPVGGTLVLCNNLFLLAVCSQVPLRHAARIRPCAAAHTDSPAPPLALYSKPTHICQRRETSMEPHTTLCNPDCPPVRT